MFFTSPTHVQAGILGAGSEHTVTDGQRFPAMNLRCYSDRVTGRPSEPRTSDASVSRARATVARVRRVGGQVAELERVGLEIVELMRLVLAYPANVFVSTEAHRAVIDVGDPRERILVAVVLHQEGFATALATAECMRQQ